jgi:hypothetical protein
MSEPVYYVIEPVVQSRETDRDDLTNSDVVTMPVVDGPFHTERKALTNAWFDRIVVEHYPPEAGEQETNND